MPPPRQVTYAKASELIHHKWLADIVLSGVQEGPPENAPAQPVRSGGDEAVRRHRAPRFSFFFSFLFCLTTLISNACAHPCVLDVQAPRASATLTRTRTFSAATLAFTPLTRTRTRSTPTRTPAYASPPPTLSAARTHKRVSAAPLPDRQQSRMRIGSARPLGDCQGLRRPRPRPRPRILSGRAHSRIASTCACAHTVSTHLRPPPHQQRARSRPPAHWHPRAYAHRPRRRLYARCQRQRPRLHRPRPAYTRPCSGIPRTPHPVPRNVASAHLCASVVHARARISACTPTSAVL
ncbi:hypothetical protein PLICRDRAFT_47370 [Plicaturopsis crispa FD-325 SS-3]|uniref:Unplaced genomic scaffold PLICRscaffold_26, whole genome shotgun sequence n=1 Tax=Plicaturopsis crispa FD-325 SS-3 TaxID=944288 RepID=A0A0C9SK91_PLICR|nr:hypothetical protein PLICRDRAFT_47370 [Plicaturopsis crispa FD-325 SS-3]